jgi:hypothetical protein
MPCGDPLEYQEKKELETNYKKTNWIRGTSYKRN